LTKIRWKIDPDESFEQSRTFEICGYEVMVRRVEIEGEAIFMGSIYTRHSLKNCYVSKKKTMREAKQAVIEEVKIKLLSQNEMLRAVGLELKRIKP
jgi:hypothetical protein